MKIVDKHDKEIQTPDFAKGYIEKETIVKHHEAVKGVEEEGHYETIAEYPNGGKDVQWVVDVPGVEAVEAWDEEISVLRYIEYTAEELAQREANRKPTALEQLAHMQKSIDRIFSILEKHGIGESEEL